MAGRFGDGRFTNLNGNAEARRTEPRMGKTSAVEPRRILSGLVFRARPEEVVVVRDVRRARYS